MTRSETYRAAARIVLAGMISLAAAFCMTHPVAAKEYETAVLGSWEQDADADDGAEPIEWLIVDESEDACLYVTKYAIENVPYNDEESEVTWADSSIRAWLNSEFMEQAFSQEERAKIVPVTLENVANPDHGTSTGENTLDSVFLLDVQEVGKYFPDVQDRVAEPSEAVKEDGIILLHDNCLWRLRTSGRTEKHAVVVLTTGEYDYCGLNVSYELACIRPAMWVAK